MEELLKKILTPLLPRFAEPIMQKYQKTLNFPPREMIHTKLGIKKHWWIERVSRFQLHTFFFEKREKNCCRGSCDRTKEEKELPAICLLAHSSYRAIFLEEKSFVKLLEWASPISWIRHLVFAFGTYYLKKRGEAEEVLLLSCCFQKSITVKLLL